MATSSVGKPIILDSESAKRFRKALSASPKKLVVTKKTIQKVHTRQHDSQ